MKTSNVDNIYYLGDIHGNFELISYYCKTKLLNNSIIIQVGDFGVGFTKKNLELSRLTHLNNELLKKDIRLLVIRGNHDNKDYWDNNIVNLSNIVFVNDYSVIEINKEKYLFIGGADSIDRDTRIEGEDWWKSESIVFGENEAKLLEDMEDIKVVITHAAPTFIYPFPTKRTFDRPILDNIFYILNKKNKIIKHYYGHYHTNEVTYIGETKHILLGIGEIVY